MIHPELPRFDNSGYVVTLGGTRLYHPGDALTGPGEDVDVLCLPVSAPWLKVSEAIDFAREVGAPRNLAIHDRVYSEAGLGIVDGHLGAVPVPGRAGLHPARRRRGPLARGRRRRRQPSRSPRSASRTRAHSGEDRSACWWAATIASSRASRARPWRDRCTATRRRSTTDCCR